MTNELKVLLSCPQCEWKQIIFIFLDEDSVFSISDKFCPKCLHILSRELLESNEIVEPDESADPDSETPTSGTFSEHTGELDVPEDGVDSPEDA